MTTRTKIDQYASDKLQTRNIIFTYKLDYIFHFADDKTAKIISPIKLQEGEQRAKKRVKDSLFSHSSDTNYFEHTLLFSLTKNYTKLNVEQWIIVEGKSYSANSFAIHHFFDENGHPDKRLDRGFAELEERCRNDSESVVDIDALWALRVIGISILKVLFLELLSLAVNVSAKESE